MEQNQPPDFSAIADQNAKGAFLRGRPEVIELLRPSTKLFKWTQSITTPRGISSWWQFLESRHLSNGVPAPGIRELQMYAARLGVHDRDYNRTRLAVTNQWNKMTQPVAIELLRSVWGYIGRASGQPTDLGESQVYFIGGEYQVWIPGLVPSDIRQISILPYLEPNSQFGAKA
jgi:hypothetical protein